MDVDICRAPRGCASVQSAKDRMCACSEEMCFARNVQLGNEMHASREHNYTSGIFLKKIYTLSNGTIFLRPISVLAEIIEGAYYN